MTRVCALFALILFLCSCDAPAVPEAAAAPAPATLPSVTPMLAPTILPSVTPMPPPTPPLAPTVPTAVVLPPIFPTATPVGPTPVPPPQYDLVLTGGTLIDATGGPPLPHAAVAVKDGLIAWVGPAAELSFSPETPVYDLTGGSILPGLINAHVHISGLGEDDMRGWTRAGVTTVRDLAGPLDERLPLRNSLLARGDATLPRLLASGPVVTVAGGYPFAVSDARLRVAAIAVQGPDDARRQVNLLADAGVDQVKISVSGRTDVSWPELSDAEIAAISEAAHARGLRVTAHVDRAAALRRAVLNGIDDAAHSPRDRVPDEVFALMVERGVTMAPTIAVYEALALSRGKAVEWRRLTLPILYDNLRRFVAAGGTLALGDDFGGVPGMAVGLPLAEINHWLAAGLTPSQIIEAATRGGAAATGLMATHGTVEVGKVADLLVVAGDPLADISALARPVMVLRSGQLAGP